MLAKGKEGINDIHIYPSKNNGKERTEEGRRGILEGSYTYNQPASN